MKCMHTQGVDERSEPHSLYIILLCTVVVSYYSMLFTLRMVQNMMISIDDPMAPKMLIGSTNVANETSEIPS